MKGTDKIFEEMMAENTKLRKDMNVYTQEI